MIVARLAPSTSSRKTPFVAPTVTIDSVEIASIPLADAVDRILEAVDSSAGGLVLTHNLEHLRQIRTNVTFRDVARSADLAVADGMPLVWASRIAGHPLPGRVNGTDLFLELLRQLDTIGASVYLAGGLNGAAERAAAVAKRRYPSLNLAGAHSPPPGLSGSGIHAVVKLAEEIAAAKPEIVFIGLPSFLQASLGRELRRLLPSAVVVGVGVSFSYLAGDLRRAPEWMQRNGLEWVHRLRTQPRELGSRYLVRCAPLGIKLMIDSARARRRRPTAIAKP